eukprot:COSAG02_NODE_15004_length_1215_cov_1.352151_1_plen_69_part_10
MEIAISVAPEPFWDSVLDVELCPAPIFDGWRAGSSRLLRFHYWSNRPIVKLCQISHWVHLLHQSSSAPL